jgi:hypothetical protein
MSFSGISCSFRSIAISSSAVLARIYLKERSSLRFRKIREKLYKVGFYVV